MGMKRRIFDTPLVIFEEEKFSSVRRDNEYFLKTRRSKMQQTAQHKKKRFFSKTGIGFL